MLILRLVHLLAMAVWFGSAVFSVRDVRTALAAGPAHIPLLRDRMRAVGMASGISGLATLVTGFALIHMLGGMASVPRGIHIGMVTGIFTVVAGAAGVGGVWRQIEAKLDQGADPASLAPLLRRLGAASGVFQGLWVVTLMAMVFRGVL